MGHLSALPTSRVWGLGSVELFVDESSRHIRASSRRSSSNESYSTAAASDATSAARVISMSNKRRVCVCVCVCVLWAGFNTLSSSLMCGGLQGDPLCTLSRSLRCEALAALSGAEWRPGRWKLIPGQNTTPPRASKLHLPTVQFTDV